MKLVCPRCAARSRIPAERVPAKGAWARCPKCEERFFVKSKGPETPVGQAPDLGTGVPGPHSRSPEAQRIIDRLRGPREAEAESRLAPPRPDQELVTVFPEAAADYRLYFLGLILVVVFMAVGVAMLFKESLEVSPVASQPTLAEFKVTEFGQDQLRANLAYIRKSTNRRNHFTRRITTPGPEFQVFETLLERLAPGGCSGLDTLVLESKSPAGGFEVLALCRPKGLYEFKMSVRWRDGFAVITMPGRRESVSIALSQEAARAETSPTASVIPAGLQPVTSIVGGQVVESFEPVPTPPATGEAPGEATSEATIIEEEAGLEEARLEPALETVPAEADRAYGSYEDFLAGQ